jgi:hypothetical protein
MRQSVISLLCIAYVAGVSSVQAFLGSGVPLAVGMCARAQLFFTAVVGFSKVAVLFCESTKNQRGVPFSQ